MAWARLPFAWGVRPLGVHWEGCNSIVQSPCNAILVYCHSMGIYEYAYFTVYMFSCTHSTSFPVAVEVQFQYSRVEVQKTVIIPKCHSCPTSNMKDTSIVSSLTRTIPSFIASQVHYCKAIALLPRTHARILQSWYREHQ